MILENQIDAGEAELVDASIDLGNGALGAAPAERGPGVEFVRMLRHDAGEMVVDAGGPIIGLAAAQQFRPWHAVAQHGHANAEVFHITQFGVHIGVAQRGGVPVAAAATNEIRAAFQHALGQRGAAGQVDQVVEKDEMAVHINTHRALRVGDEIGRCSRTSLARLRLRLKRDVRRGGWGR